MNTYQSSDKTKGYSGRSTCFPDGRDAWHTVEKSYAPHSKYAVVIPAYNEAETIRNVVQRSLVFIDDVIVVDDGSTDDTSKNIEDLPVMIMKNSTNMGKAACLWKGFQHAIPQKFQAVITLDGDGQHLPEDIPRLIEEAERVPQHIIIGARQGNWNRQSWHRKVANQIADFWISWASGYAIVDSQSGFRVYPCHLLRMLKCKHDAEHSFVFESEVLIEGAKLGYQSRPVSIQSNNRKTMRNSHFRPILDITRITKMVAWKLLSRGMYVTGLYQSLRARWSHDQARQEVPTSPPVLPNS
ncbi:MAG: glycosyl transferase [Nitrospirales bacterium]|nr:MAG: glycosyl transferase [Nitrospirales bacterium]